MTPLARQGPQDDTSYQIGITGSQPLPDRVNRMTLLARQGPQDDTLG